MMRNIKKWFTLVELLVSITILAIISVVAYQSFGWVTWKANNARKIQDITTIETSLNMIYSEKNYYPIVDEKSEKNSFWYDKNIVAQASNSFDVEKDQAEIKALSNARWGWKVMGKWALSSKQIWAKWTISQNNLGKEYLTKDLYDIEIWDLKEKNTWKKLIEKWIGKYVYAVYNKWLSNWNWTSNLTWTSYNIAATFKEENWDLYLTKISWPYSDEKCWADKDKCPVTLIWSGDNFLVEWQKMGTNNSWANLTWDFDSKAANQWIPYPINNF